MEDNILTTGAIIGIVIASLILIMLIIFITIVIICRRHRDRPKPSSGTDTPNTTTSEISTISGAHYTAVNGSRHQLHRGGETELDQSFQDTMELDPNESFVPPAVVQPPPYSPRDYRQSTNSHPISGRLSGHYGPQRNSMIETMSLDEPPPPYDGALNNPLILNSRTQLCQSQHPANMFVSSHAPSNTPRAATPRRNNMSHSSLPTRRPRPVTQTLAHEYPIHSRHQTQRSHDMTAVYQPKDMPLQTLSSNRRPIVPSVHSRLVMNSTPTHGRGAQPRTVPNTNPYLQAMRSSSSLRNPLSSNASQCSSSSSRTQSPANLIDNRQHIPLTYTDIPTPIHPSIYPMHSPNHTPTSHISPSRILTTLTSRNPPLLLLPHSRLTEHERNIYNSSTDNSEEPIYAEPDLSNESGISYGNENEPIYACVDEEHVMPSYLTGSNV